MDNKLAREFHPGALIRFALPNIVMMVFMSLYTIVDGMFISRLVGTLALSAVNMSYPLSSLQLALGIMLGTGGSAVIAREMGEGKDALASGGSWNRRCICPGGKFLSGSYSRAAGDQ